MAFAFEKLVHLGGTTQAVERTDALLQLIGQRPAN
jgi:hypothetical protein